MGHHLEAISSHLFNNVSHKSEKKGKHLAKLFNE